MPCLAPPLLHVSHSLRRRAQFALFRLRTLALASFPQSTGFLLVAIGVACFFFLKLIVMFFLIPLLHLGHAPSLDDAASEMGREHDETLPTPSTWVPLFWSFVSGLSTGVGALVVLFIPRVSNRNTSFLLAAAGGVMVTLSVGDVIWNGVQSFGYHFASSLVAAGTLSYFGECARAGRERGREMFVCRAWLPPHAARG